MPARAAYAISGGESVALDVRKLVDAGASLAILASDVPGEAQQTTAHDHERSAEAYRPVSSKINIATIPAAISRIPAAASLNP